MNNNIRLANHLAVRYSRITWRSVGTLILFAALVSALPADDAAVTVRLTTREAATGEPTPARVEVRGEGNKFYVATDAMHVGHVLKNPDDPPPIPTLEDHLATLSQRIHNVYMHAQQFYCPGQCTLKLPPGKYSLRAFKGTEYRTTSAELSIAPGTDPDVKLDMERWIDMPASGWYSADAHLHIPRFGEEMNEHILRWMQAEDLHVANLLQWGHSRHFHNAAQYAHGPRGVYQDGRYIVASGQENPRTPFLGHTILLGTKKPIHFPEQYLIYRRVFAEGRKQGTVNGYSHKGMLFHAQNGMALDLPTGLIDFVEVLQFGTADYSVWYLALNSGYRLTPLAGTDYPVAPIPGWERFYARVDGDYDFPTWLESVRRGEVFVTNGPVLDCDIHGKPMGGQLTLNAPGEIRVTGSVRFNSERDDVKQLQVIRNGRVIRKFAVEPGADSISCDFKLPVDEACWVALRAWGFKSDAFIPGLGFRQPVHSGPASEKAEWNVAPALAHTAPIFVEIEGQAPFAETDTAHYSRWAWLARLRDLEETLRHARTNELYDDGTDPTWDAVSKELIEDLRQELFDAIRDAEGKYYLGD